MELFSPATRDEAVALVQSLSPTFDMPSQHRFFGRESLDALFDRGLRRPDLIWAVRSGDAPNQKILGLIGVRAFNDAFGLVDLFALPDAAHPDAEPATKALLGAATAWARTREQAEASFGVPASDRPLDRPAVRSVVDALAEHGWEVLVTRRHYQFEPAPGLGDGIGLSATLERAGDGDRDRLESLILQMLPGSLDEHDLLSIAERGVEAAAANLVDELLEGDPIDSIRFAVVDGKDVGFVSYRLMANGFAYVAQVGVAQAFRGRGLAKELVAAATRSLIAEGAGTLVANTDDGNWPMARAFADVGWTQTESRIDLTLGQG